MPGIRNLFRIPFVFGTTIVVLVILLNISIASIAEGSLKGGYSVFLSNGIFVYLVPLAVGVQMGLFRHHRNITTEKKLCCFDEPVKKERISLGSSNSEKIGITGSITSSLTMILCCLHHVTDLLPAVGFILAASSFLTQYKDAIIILGLLANLAGSVAIARAILKEGVRREASPV